MYNIVCFYHCNFKMADIASCILLKVVDYLSGFFIDVFLAICYTSSEEILINVTELTDLMSCLFHHI